MAPEIVVDKPESLAARLAARLEGAAAHAVAARGRFAVALPGGSVATRFFPALAAAGVDWSRTEFFWGDERAVPADDPDSNFGVARALWLETAAVPAGRIHRMEAERVDIEAAAADYAREMVRVLGDPPRLDVALLGVGPDGHVCSLFPGHEALREEARWVVAVVDSPKPPSRRLTLTLPTLAAARSVIVVAVGSAKAPVLGRALAESSPDSPLTLVSRRANRVTFLLDAAAAANVVLSAH